jgi:hypothetical protein
MGCGSSLNEALTLRAAKAAAGPPARLIEVTGAPMRTRLPPAECRRNGQPVCWQCGNTGRLRSDCPQRPDREVIFIKIGKRVM